MSPKVLLQPKSVRPKKPAAPANGFGRYWALSPSVVLLRQPVVAVAAAGVVEMTVVRPAVSRHPGKTPLKPGFKDSRVKVFE
jgi:hypothetical protein